jgi:hypothetical protein
MTARWTTVWVLLCFVGQIANAEKASWLQPATTGSKAKARITLRQGRVLTGAYNAYGTDELSFIGADGTSSTVNRADVCRVVILHQRSRWKGALWGAAAGFVAAFPAGALSAGYLTDRNNPSASLRMGVGATLGLFGAGIGAGIGTLAGGSRNETVYRAPNETVGCSTPTHP